MSRKTLLRELPHLAAIGAMFIYAIVRWPGAPDRFPAHWDFSGEVDRFGGKFEGLLLLPLIALGLYLLLLAIPRIDPSRENYKRFSGVYSVIRLVLLAVMGFLYIIIQVSAAGNDIDMNLTMGLLMGALIFVLGSVMGRIKPNYMVGVRTPWTLASQVSWAKTHRVTGWAFMASGAASIIVTLIWPTAGIIVLIATIIGGVVLAFGYSYWAYSKDDERIPVMGSPKGAKAREE